MIDVATKEAAISNSNIEYKVGDGSNLEKLGDFGITLILIITILKYFDHLQTLLQLSFSSLMLPHEKNY